jgi:hypothetical protein
VFANLDSLQRVHLDKHLFTDDVLKQVVQCPRLDTFVWPGQPQLHFHFKERIQQLLHSAKQLRILDLAAYPRGLFEINPFQQIGTYSHKHSVSVFQQMLALAPASLRIIKFPATWIDTLRDCSALTKFKKLRHLEFVTHLVGYW